ncbi:MAG: dihydroorotate dehydrogenase electron transfer subunit [Methanothermobacter sp.]|nr:dihydroorotate dehydrogenase electron transfer subunit [Methanothermobacter sp.]
MGNVPEVLEIKGIVEESETVRTFIFDWDFRREIVPGQFVMVWNFSDEKPMSVSLIDHKRSEIGVSIRRVGEFTSAVHELEEGDLLGVRGPYGRGFELMGRNLILVGGGIGMAPLAALAEEAVARGMNVDAVVAARTSDELLFTERLDNAGVNIHTCTDDGTCGFQGFAHERLSEIDVEYDMAAVCGPEPMMFHVKAVLDERGIPAQFSLERYMKCAVGICGQCCVDGTGWRVCAEGPVFWDHELRGVGEFGRYRRDAAGRRISW